MGLNYTLCRKAAFQSIFLRFDVIENTENRDKCNQLFEVNRSIDFIEQMKNKMNLEPTHLHSREKLDQYEMDVSFMFPIEQEQCPETNRSADNSAHFMPSKRKEFSSADKN